MSNKTTRGKSPPLGKVLPINDQTAQRLKKELELSDLAGIDENGDLVKSVLNEKKQVNRRLFKAWSRQRLKGYGERFYSFIHSIENFKFLFHLFSPIFAIAFSIYIFYVLVFGGAETDLQQILNSVMGTGEAPTLSTYFLLSVLCSIVLLAVVEILKGKVFNSFFEIFFAENRAVPILLAFGITLGSVSVISSYYGSYDFARVKTLPTLKDESKELAALDAQIVTATQQYNSLANRNWKSTKELNYLQSLRAERNNRANQLQAENASMRQDAENRRSKYGNLLSIFALLNEMIIGLIYYSIHSYDKKSIENNKLTNIFGSLVNNVFNQELSIKKQLQPKGAKAPTLSQVTQGTILVEDTPLVPVSNSTGTAIRKQSKRKGTVIEKPVITKDTVTKAEQLKGTKRDWSYGDITRNIRIYSKRISNHKEGGTDSQHINLAFFENVRDTHDFEINKTYPYTSPQERKQWYNLQTT